ncbi:MAG: rhamnogalacturonan acetylesterase [Pedobacter sp.]|nr:MAG: rhamnogalacturonan acetylesterase [Pedobacter sp.]
MKTKYLNIALILTFVVLSSCIVLKQNEKPTLFLIGDSTVKNGKGKGDGLLWGWGSFIGEFFDANKINIENNALGGTSSRTFQTNGLWEPVLAKVKKGDFVMMQFGHNDSSPLDDTARARGTIKGIGTESKEIYNPIKKKQEVVYTYGWYLRKFINDVKAKGATPIVCSSIPRNPVKNGVVVLANDTYAKWAEEVAKAEKVDFIPLNQLIKDNYGASNADVIKTYFTEKDHTHTNEAGAKLNASLVVKGLKTLKKSQLNKYLK